MEEERRLFYVAITRAKEKLWISYANNRYRYGSLVQNDPSRFIEELPKEMVDSSMAVKASFNSPKQKGLFNNDNPIQQKKVVNHAVTSTHKASAGFKADNPNSLQEGMKIEHERFGFGKIMTLEGPANNKIATINFEGAAGQKKIMLNYAKLSIVV